MTNDITPSDGGAADRERHLAHCAESANQAHARFRDAAQQAVAHALEAGQSLLEAKSLCGKGTWLAWLEVNFKGATTTAQGYMRLAAYVRQLGGDARPLERLNYKQALKLIARLPRSDDRAGPRRASTEKLPAPAVGERALPAPRSAGDASAEQPSPPMASSGHPFEQVGRLLEQAVAELRRLVALRQHSDYAQHLMQPLERIRCGIGTYRWFWDMLER